MGMLSLAGIVSGAGAGAGKSLRQAQTYLNWEMLQEERGKLELARDERINERHIAQLQEARTFAASERDREEKEYNDPARIERRFNTERLVTKYKQREYRENEPFREEQRQEQVSIAFANLKDKEALELEALKGPEAEVLREAIRSQAKKTREDAIIDIEGDLEFLTKHPKIFELKQAISKMSLTDMEKFAYNKAKFEDTHRGQAYQATIDDKNISHLQLAANSIEKQIGVIEKALTGATDPVQIQSLSKRLRYLEKEDGLVMGRIMKLTTGTTIPPFDMPVPEPKDTAKPTVGTQSKVLGHVGEAAKRRAGAVGEAVSPALEKAMEVVRRSGIYGVIPITGMVMDVPAVSE